MLIPSGPTEFRPRPGAQRQRQCAEERGHGRHQDRAEAQQAGLENRVRWSFAFLPLRLQGEVDHHDAVLLHDADQKDDADDGNHVEVLVEEHQREQGAQDRGRAG